MHRQRGQVLPFVAILIGVLLGFAGLAVDVGYLRYQQRIQQSATDSAALAGAAELIYATDYTTAAKADAARNGFTDGVNNVTVSPVNPPSAGNYTADGKAVQVTISSQQPTFFMKVFGRANVTVTTRAVATASTATNNSCFIQLNPNGNGNLNGTTFNGPECGVALNKNRANLRGSTWNAASIQYGGAGPNTTGATFLKATPAPAIPATDPCPQISGCAWLANNPPSTTPCVAPAIVNGFALPGCYPGGTWPDNLTLNPGVYVINGNVNIGKGTLNGNGVTIVIASGGNMVLQQGTLNLSAPTTGDTAGILFYDTNTGNAPNFNKTTNNFTGVLYIPKATVNYNKAGGGYQLLIFGDANFNQNTMNFTGASSTGSFIRNAVLVE